MIYKDYKYQNLETLYFKFDIYHFSAQSSQFMQRIS
jgi:hypothetical protein